MDSTRSLPTDGRVAVSRAKHSFRSVSWACCSSASHGEALRPRLDAKALTLEQQFSPVTVLGDRARLGQVLANLLSNAMKFTPEGGQIKVLVDTADGAAPISVADSGPGIPSDEQGRVLERFWRGSAPRGTSGRGIGNWQRADIRTAGIHRRPFGRRALTRSAAADLHCHPAGADRQSRVARQGRAKRAVQRRLDGRGAEARSDRAPRRRHAVSAVRIGSRLARRSGARPRVRRVVACRRGPGRTGRRRSSG